MMNIRQEAVFSQAFVRISGQRPAAFMTAVRMEMGMRMPVSGRARRLVRRKYMGNVLKWCHASGAVVSWQLIVRAELSHILFVIGHALSSSHRPFMRGYIHAIPAIAA